MGHQGWQALTTLAGRECLLAEGGIRGGNLVTQFPTASPTHFREARRSCGPLGFQS